MSNIICCRSMATAACIWHIDFPYCSLEAFGVFGLNWRIMLLPKRHSTSGLPMTAPYLPHSFLLCRCQADQSRNLSDKNGTYTSSTARGGGGSFKNRKPIGELGCESGMAERSHWWTERWLELCLLEWLQWLQWSPHPQLLDVVSCTATVVVVVA